MNLSKEQLEKVDATGWYSFGPYEHIKPDDCRDAVDETDAIEGNMYTRLASPHGTSVTSQAKFRFRKSGLVVESGELTISFASTGLRSTDIVLKRVDGKKGEVTISVHDTNGKVLQTVTETLGDSDVKVLLEDLPGALGELRFKGDSFVLLRARAIDTPTIKPAQGEWPTDGEWK